MAKLREEAFVYIRTNDFLPRLGGELASGAAMYRREEHQSHCVREILAPR